MTLEIISPEKVFFKGEVEIIIVPGTKGQFTVLPHHAPIISALSKGDVIYVIDDKNNRLAIESGFIEVHKDAVSICVEQLAVEKDKAE
ncbi:MAG: ATP synthase F1 subunit epsilon [Prevotellaceae bacterium]|jgi:F-type H+-transporting ATPase subunit epsilon|nr:ATP synthase F1 subunit epsilon [Prevotellaceae bacterium]